MSQLKKSQVVMLPTIQKAEIGLLALYKDVYKNKEYFLDIIHRIEMQDYLKVWTRNGLLSEDEESRGECTYQHLYITSDDEIKEGDWIYERNFNNETFIYQIYKRNDRLCFFRFTNVPIYLDRNTNNAKKIIATTDKALKLFNP